MILNKQLIALIFIRMGGIWFDYSLFSMLLLWIVRFDSAGAIRYALHPKKE
jgi:hypothetical protein